MAGHSKWANIKRKKGAQDQKRGKLFTRAIHEITVAVKEGGGGDPGGNPRLRLAIDKAKAVNVSNDTIERAVRRASGEEKADESHELSYEGYGPGGAAVLVHVLTDNKNRTVAEIRHAFSRSGGTLGENGCVAWMFDKKGLFAVPRQSLDEEQIMELVLEAGAEDVKDETEVWEVICEPNSFHQVRLAFESRDIPLDFAEISYLPKTRVELSGDDAEKMMRMLETLEDLDDVLQVSSNSDFVDPTQ